MSNPVIARLASFVSEAQKVNTSLTVLEGQVVAIENLPTLLARRIDIGLKATTNSVQVVLRCYAGSKRLFTDTTLFTAAAGSTEVYVYDNSSAGPGSEFVGQTADILVQNTNGQATGDPAVYDLWVGARS